MDLFIAAMYQAGSRRAAILKGQTESEQTITKAAKNILESYHYLKTDKGAQIIREQGDQIFLDSGAFSAWTLGVTIDLPTYCNFILRNGDIIRKDDGVIMASVLDGIGDPLQTYRNQLAMEHYGVSPLPCFHYGEDERYLEYYISKYPYITIGGMVGKSKTQLRVWLDRIWEKYIIDGSGAPKLKLHGFGLTSIPMMKDYPWYSVDSSSWVQSATFGSIVIPNKGAISISEQSPSRHTKGQHITTLTDIEREYILKTIAAQGFDYERLASSFSARAAYNLWAFGEINATINEAETSKFKAHIQELF